jgi:ribonuclease D
LAACRDVIAAIAEREQVLAQNLLASDSVRRLAWSPPSPIDTATVTAQLTRLEARPWQIALTADGLATALIAAANPAPDLPPEPAAAPAAIDPTGSEPAG